MLGSPLASVDVNVNSRNSAPKAKVSKQYQKKSHLEHSESKVVGETTRGAREMREEWETAKFTLSLSSRLIRNCAFLNFV